MAPPFSHQVKFDRACHHLDALERAERGEEPQAYVLADEPDPDGPGRVGRVKKMNFAYFGCLIGDCVHNLRSSLDLALELAVANVNPLPAGYEEDSGFPIFWKQAMISSEEEKRIGSIHPVAKTIIKDLQPHVRGQDYVLDPLWKLHELDRIDKHRSLHLTEFRAMKVGLSGTNFEVEGLQMVGKGDEVQSGAVVAAYQATPVDPNSEMNVNLRLEGQVAFQKVPPFPGQLVVPILQDIRNYVQDHVFFPLTPYL